MHHHSRLCAMPLLNRDNLQQYVGQSIGTSSWVEVPQSRIDAFADCTEDRQWIHIDVDRAKRESPFGAPIAHGFLTLSLLPITSYELLGGLKPTKSVNYGLDKLRFMSPVAAGSRVRNHIKLLAAEPREDGWTLLRTENTVEIEGQPKPALVAVSLGLFSWA
ncbi:MaoC family dehydratase [Variovorax sp. J2P1-59]|uniref:MaoC family dehydratase n=1 Tax=Variovorax flavidus TaxID=3053501 RepID=UPI0025768986|nr:MaoC family dehydratase [Variovorax sp. J2P1-59]MDM0075982.1 MaoC family dehydratase [Variovorax sp. J2P1-59]